MDKHELDRIAQRVEEDTRNYSHFDASMNNNFDSMLNYDKPSVLNYQGEAEFAQLVAGLTTFEATATYTPVAAVPAPVNIELFGNIFNTGTIVGQDIVFTNAGGDFVTLHGETESIVALFRRSETQPFNIKFSRMDVQNAGQFRRPLQFTHRSVWGGGKNNRLTPSQFITPEQFQLLRVDLMMNLIVDADRGYNVDINPTETGNGTSFTWFIDTVVNNTNKVAGRPELELMKGGEGIIQQNMPAVSQQQQINELTKAVSSLNQKLITPSIRRR